MHAPHSPLEISVRSKKSWRQTYAEGTCISAQVGARLDGLHEMLYAEVREKVPAKEIKRISLRKKFPQLAQLRCSMRGKSILCEWRRETQTDRNLHGKMIEVVSSLK
jgi:hypothetical protein